MDEYYPHEPGHVGHLLKGHRDALGVTVEQLGRELGRRGTAIAFHIEHQATPSYAEVEHHHQGLIEAYLTAGTPKPIGLARREQWWATAADMALWQAAAAENPPVNWWWGTRSGADGRGAWCNLCSLIVHGYDSGRGMTRRARMGVMAHRLEHVNALITTDSPILKEARP
jgi:hypothetical protein